MAAAGGPAHQSSSAAAAAAAAYPSYYSSYYHYYYGYSAGEALQGPSSVATTEHGLRHTNHTTASAVTSATAPAYGQPPYSLEGEHAASEYEAGSGSSSSSSTNIRRHGDTGSEFPTSPAPTQLHEYGSLMAGGCNLSGQDNSQGEGKVPVVYPPPILPPHSHSGLSYTPVSEAYGQIESDFDHAPLAGYESSSRPLHDFASHDHLQQRDSTHDHDPVSDPEGEPLLHDAP